MQPSIAEFIPLANAKAWRLLLLWTLVILYAAARVSQAYPNRIPMVAIVALHVIPPLLFALVHGALRYGVRGILVFIGLCLVIGNLFENLSTLTGLPDCRKAAHRPAHSYHAVGRRLRDGCLGPLDGSHLVQLRARMDVA